MPTPVPRLPVPSICLGAFRRQQLTVARQASPASPLESGALAGAIAAVADFGQLAIRATH